MNKHQLRRLEEAFAPSDAGEARICATPEDRRQMLADGLPAFLRHVFGVDDERADPTRLEAMTLEQLRALYWLALRHDIARWREANPPELEAFRRLPTSEKVRLLRRDCRTWPAELRHS
jgi:hypothetical protein